MESITNLENIINLENITNFNDLYKYKHLLTREQYIKIYNNLMMIIIKNSNR